jgi:hypothetical protein
MFYVGKPDTAPSGLVGANIIYESDIWPDGKDYGVLPDQATFDAIVRSHLTQPGPVVLDIEGLPLTGPPARVTARLTVLETLADWTRAVAPDRMVGYYGYHTLTDIAPAHEAAARQLAAHVEAFYPSMYTFDDDQSAWAAKAAAEVAEDRALGPGKPIFIYLWPQYHDKTARQYQYLDAQYWTFELQTARSLADGVVIWSPQRFDWDTASGWWSATQEFVRSLQAPSG